MLNVTKNYNNLSAIIPARAGSKRLIDKNILPFMGESLLQRKVNQIKKAGINRIIVSSDSQEYLDSVDCLKHKRRPGMSGSKISTADILPNILKEMNVEGDILLAHCTCPLITEEHFKKAINIYKTEDCDSVISVVKIQRPLWNEKGELSIKGNVYGVNWDMVPSFYYPSHGIYIMKSDNVLKREIGNNIYFYEVDTIAGIDIDYQEQYELALYYAKK